MSILHDFISENRLIRGTWFGTDAQGRATACLYSALTGSDKPEQCPASVMPEWMAHLTPWIDDAGTDEHWPVVVRRYADLQVRWHVLDAADWQQLEWRTRHIIVSEAMRHTDDAQAVEACRSVLALLDRAMSGDIPNNAEWATAATARARAMAAAAWATAAAAWASATAAWASATAAAATARAAWATAAAAWASATAAEASDRMIDAILDAIQARIETREGK